MLQMSTARASSDTANLNLVHRKNSAGAKQNLNLVKQSAAPARYCSYAVALAAGTITMARV
jgi:hypothetical protein